MFLRWKTRAHASHRPTRICTHTEPTESITPVICQSFREANGPRQGGLWRPAGAIRRCCIDDPLARAAWWADLKRRWQVIRDELDGDVATLILAQRKRWMRELGEVVAPPNAAERQAYRNFLRRKERKTIFLSEDVFPLLDLKWPFTEEQLKSAFRSTVMRAHPDHGGDARRFQEIMTAYEAAKKRLGSERP